MMNVTMFRSYSDITGGISNFSKSCWWLLSAFYISVIVMEIFASVIFFLSFMSTILPAIAFSHRGSHFHINNAPKSTFCRILPHTHRRNYGLHQTSSDEQSGLFRRKNIPILGVAVGFTALCFQVLILYPWHELLRNDFTALEVRHLPPLIYERPWV